MFEEEKPPLLKEFYIEFENRKAFIDNITISNTPLLGQGMEAQRDDTWQKASLIYEAKIEKAKAEGAREIIDWVENNIKTICIYGEDFPKFEFDWQSLKARYGVK